MRKLSLLFLLVPGLCFATAYTASQSGDWNSSATWGGDGVPGFGDTVSIPEYTVTIPASTTVNIGTVNTTSMTIGDGTHAAGLTIAGTLNLRGTGTLAGPFYDCTHGPTVAISTGGTLNLDENNGANASGFVIASSTAPCTKFTFGTSGDVCTWGSSPTCPTNVNSTNNGSANGILLKDSGTDFGASVTKWYGTAINNCGATSTSVAGCYQVEMYQSASSWAWNQVYLNTSAAFGANPATGLPNDSSPATIANTISSGRLQSTDLFFGSQCSHGVYGSFTSSTPAGSNVTTNACTGARSITNSLIRMLNYAGTAGDAFTAGAQITDVFFEGLATNGYYSSLTGANVAGGYWSYVVAWSDAQTCSENEYYTTILAPVADHVYAICTDAVGVPILLGMAINKNWGTNGALTNAIFDPAFGNVGGGHAFVFGNDGSSDSGYSMTESYITVLQNPVLGYGLNFSAWSDLCPAAPTTSITHILATGQPSIGGWYACESSSSPGVAPALSIYKANIYYDTVARMNPLSFGGGLTDLSSQPANLVPPTGVDYNVNYKYSPAVINATVYSTACAGNTCTNNGSPYAIPMTGSSPGAHDQNINPSLLDNTRNGYKWAALRGQAASAAGFRQVFINGGPALIHANIASLFYYINVGNIPSGKLWNAYTDQTTIGPSQPTMTGWGSSGLRKVTQ